MPEVVSESSKARVVRYTAEEAREKRAEALAAMGITLEDYRRIIAESGCRCCARPAWTERWDSWDEVGHWDWLLGNED